MFQSKLHHVGIVVPDLARVELLIGLLGLTRGGEEYVAEYEADVLNEIGLEQEQAGRSLGDRA